MRESADLAVPSQIAIADAAAVLSAFTASPFFHKNLDDVDGIEMWALVAMCAMSRRELPDGERCDVYQRGESRAARFAHAVGLTAAQAGEDSPAGEPGRTVPIQRIRPNASSALAAAAIAKLAVPLESEADSRDALTYVIDELLRNVLQHSGDPLGAVVGAQRMNPGKGGYERATVQVAVADTGRGILASLQRSHGVETPEEALEKALRPHVSGTFAEGQTGSLDNAGLGLFFTSEMAKLTYGRLLLATRGGALLLDGDAHAETHELSILKPPGTGFPGTLAVFELPLEIQDRDAILEVIRARATERTPAPVTRTWLTYRAPAEGVESFLVREALQDPTVVTTMAAALRERVAHGKAVALDFQDIDIATQSFLHALLFHALRVGWAMAAPVHVQNASSAVRSGLAYLESYALR